MTQNLRADARENRDRILGTARELLSERGLGISMRDVARHAGVGPATLYRRFPTKQVLVDAAFADELRACRQIVEDGCADPDPWRGLTTVIEGLSVLNARNRGFVDAYMSAGGRTSLFARHRSAVLRQLEALAARAKRDGSLRTDFSVDDLVLVLLAGRGLSSTSPEVRTDAARRFAALALDAFRADSGNGALPRCPSLVGEVARLS
ncbi:TetR/AcrR family transcriptional regulator [Saccharopolyspora sp. TS4A08]|uniref:TetR/AcrR family transcriptional regulator n=1 Tax=Saccharopolyspora ipomoeae TaxID=3042027 RepID=A0ABT6PUH0_9PSEU|nr:TetR/AcrR family transcriptional regulator [Saccharopolyspora sp. TS4A08]MDI2031645.1 TetR/AcrR family transcriptional regulator [Saccharopolyspora sp. TS4A08]